MTTDGTLSEKLDSLDFLSSWLRESKERGDDEMRAWVSIQVGIPSCSSYSEIESRIERCARQ